MKKRSIEDIKQALNKMYPNQIFNFDNYKNIHSKLHVIDPDYGEWTPTVKNLLSKHRKCRKRYLAERKRSNLTVLQIKNRINRVHNGKVKIDISSYINTNIKCKFLDKEFGEFFMTPQHVFQGSGHKERGVLKQIKSQQLPLTIVKQRLKKVHGENVTIIDDTYNGMYHKATFIHTEYGKWDAYPNNVINKESSHPALSLKRQEATFLKKYNTKYPLQNEEIFKKVIKSRWKRVVLKHWKTNKDLICISSYEHAIVSYLNRNQINFDWQIKQKLSNGMIYFVDLYLQDSNTFVEIKGYFFNDRNKLKWELFHKDVPNSEIWFLDKISELTGKSKYTIKKEFDKEYNKKSK